MSTAYRIIFTMVGGETINVTKPQTEMNRFTASLERGMSHSVVILQGKDDPLEMTVINIQNVLWYTVERVQNPIGFNVEGGL